MSDEFFVAALLIMIALSNIPLAVMAYWYDQTNGNAIFHTLFALTFILMGMYVLAA